jgi:predicted dinucleotide-binding enzyme
MRIGVLGTGDVGKAQGKAFIALGHQVKMGARDANNEKAAAWARENGKSASHGPFADAATFGELNVLATLGNANEAALRQALVESLEAMCMVWVLTGRRPTRGTRRSRC